MLFKHHTVTKVSSVLMYCCLWLLVGQLITSPTVRVQHHFRRNPAENCISKACLRLNLLELKLQPGDEAEPMSTSSVVDNCASANTVRPDDICLFAMVAVSHTHPHQRISLSLFASPSSVFITATVWIHACDRHLGLLRLFIKAKSNVQIVRYCAL